MSKSKNVKIFKSLAVERYLIWAILFAIAVAVGLLVQIALARIQMNTDISSSSYLVNNRQK